MKHTIITIITVLAAGFFIAGAAPVSAQTASFRFGVWADTKSGTGVLNADSVSIAKKNPLFLFYPGDVCDSGPNASCFAIWKAAYNAGGDLLSKSFVSRGNHDSSGTSFWVANYDVAGAASKIGATNLTQLSTNLTYSFDYGNSHFAAVDLPGGDATTMSQAQINWLDSDLTAAEGRGVTHSFVFFHGPEYPMGGHCCTNATALAQMLGKHTSLAATFHGHEHNLAYTHLDSTKIAGVAHPYEVFTSGGGGADLYGCQRGDWCQKMTGYMTVDVNGSSYSVTAYSSAGVAQISWTFNSSNNGPTVTPVPNTPVPPTATTKPVPTSTPKPNGPTSTPIPTSTPGPTNQPVPTNTPVPNKPTATPIPGIDIQPGFPVRATFYYPWFPEAWTQLGHYPYTNYHPSLGYYDSGDTTIIAKHVQAMQYGNIQVGISSWWGQGHYTDTRFPKLLRGADGTNFRWTIYYEQEGAGNPTATQIQSDLNYIKSHYSSDKNYYRINGRPVIFVYGDPSDDCSTADRWKQANTANFYVVLKVFPGYAACASQPDNWHQYAPASAEDSQPGHSFTISPSFNKYGEAGARLGRDPIRWAVNVRDMNASNAPFQLVTTFNEWGEGSSVESATEWSSGSGFGTYLDALHGTGVVPTSIPTMPISTSTPPPVTGKPTSAPTNIPTNIPTPTPAPFVGDANGDGKVNSTDYQIWLSHYEQKPSGGTSVSSFQSIGDFNHDGRVDGIDYVIWLKTFTG
jgi:hypothetical protein